MTRETSGETLILTKRLQMIASQMSKYIGQSTKSAVTIKSEGGVMEMVVEDSTEMMRGTFQTDFHDFGPIGLNPGLLYNVVKSLPHEETLMTLGNKHIDFKSGSFSSEVRINNDTGSLFQKAVQLYTHVATAEVKVEDLKLALSAARDNIFVSSVENNPMGFVYLNVLEDGKGYEIMGCGFDRFMKTICPAIFSIPEDSTADEKAITRRLNFSLNAKQCKTMLSMLGDLSDGNTVQLVLRPNTVTLVTSYHEYSAALSDAKAPDYKGVYSRLPETTSSLLVDTESLQKLLNRMSPFTDGKSKILKCKFACKEDKITIRLNSGFGLAEDSLERWISEEEKENGPIMSSDMEFGCDVWTLIGICKAMARQSRRIEIGYTEPDKPVVFQNSKSMAVMTVIIGGQA